MKQHTFCIDLSIPTRHFILNSLRHIVCYDNFGPYKVKKMQDQEPDFDIKNLTPQDSIDIESNLGYGGSGWVVRVVYKEKVCALKILRPDVVGKTDIKNSFLKEAERLRENKHPNIVEVGENFEVKYGNNGRSTVCPAFLLEYLDPEEWKELNTWIKESEGKSKEKFYALIKIGESILKVLKFLHARDLLHLDIKNENIKVKGSLKKPMIKLLDFGVAKQFPVPGVDGDIKLTGTLRLWPKIWLKNYLERMTNKDRTVCAIPREKLNGSIDLHLFKGTIEEALDEAELIKDELELKDYNALQYYKTWLNRLEWCEDPIKGLKIQSANEAILNARRAFQWPTSAARIFGSGNLRLPLDNLENFGAASRKIVNEEDFQRLRGLRQLGFVHYVYPGGVHSRFEHSLGVYGAAIRYLKVIANHSATGFRTLLDDEDLRMTAAMALVHDLGHYPFSHQIEEARTPGFPYHETFTYMILKDNLFSKIISKLFKVDQSKLLDFALYCLNKVQKKDLSEFVETPSDVPPTWKALRGIINGPIDADKFDYLRRDAWHVGVPYSNSLDPERFIDGLTVYGNVQDGFKLAVRESAISSAEMFALGKYFMYTSVYYNHTVRCFDRLLQEAIYLSIDSKFENGESLFDKIKPVSDDIALHTILEGCSNLVLKKHLLKRIPYNRLLVINNRTGDREDEKLLDDYSRLPFTERRSIEDHLRDKINKKFKTSYEQGHFLTDIPTSKTESVTIPIVSKSGNLFDDKSSLWTSVTDNFNKTVKKLRIFVNEKPSEWGEEQQKWLKKNLKFLVRNKMIKYP